jgi:hypothetical protein
MKILLLFSVLLLITCDLSKPEEVNTAEIKEIFAEIKTAFIFSDLDAIMQKYHPQFFHNMNDYNDMYIIWQIRLNDYNSLDYDNLIINFNYDFATVQFTMWLDNDMSEEPSPQRGDLSYFYRSDGKWLLCGNQFTDFRSH